VKHSVLIIDDEQAICTSLMFALEDDYTVYTATDPSLGLAYLQDNQIDVVLLDMRIKEMNGLSLIPKILEIQPHAIIIVMTAYGTIETSVEAVKLGAYHYLTKPIDVEEVKLLIEKGLSYLSLNHQLHRLNEIVYPKEGYAGMIGKSKKMKQVYHLIERTKDISSSVLILGESGTGKELVARAIHEGGCRSKYPFLVLNCAAIPETLLESELFGHEKGAFTGAIQSKKGVFERADNGTLFLDEIGEMPSVLQAKLLRVLQEGEFVPVGATESQQVDVRVIAATNRDLLSEVQKGNFREDLFYRLHVIPISLPPVRERMEDVPLLIDYFLKLYSEKLNRPPLQLSYEAKECLFSYHYPGNVRELSNIIEYAVALSPHEQIRIEDLPSHMIQEQTGVDADSSTTIAIPFGISLKEVEKIIILETLHACNGHKGKTADILGISDRSLRDKLKMYEKEEV